MADSYAIYLRKSRADMEAEARGEGETLSRHLTMLQNLARRNGHDIAQIYREIVSGESISGRPEMQRLLADVAAGRWAGVYCTEVERLARGDTMDQGRVAEVFQFSHTKILTLAKVYDPDNDFDNEYFEFGLFMARREYKSINRRIQAGRKQSVLEGRYIYSRPAYGYRKVKIQGDKGYTLAIDEQEALVVRRVFQQYAGTDDGLVVIARQLREEGVPPGQYGSVWNESRLHRLLTNEVYLGLIRDGRDKQMKVLENGKIIKKRSIVKDYTLVQGLHPAIISRELYEACQRKLHSPRPRGTPSTPGFNHEQGVPKNDGHYCANPLAGLLVCSECGHVLRRKAACGRQRDRLFCHTPGCATVATYLDEVEQSILSTLRQWMQSAEMGGHPDPNPAIAAALARLDALKKEKAATSAQLDKLYDLLERGLYSEELFTARHIALKQRLAALDEQMAEAHRQAKTQYVPIAQLYDEIKTLLDVYDRSSAGQKNRMLKSCISKIVYHKSQRGNIINGRIVADACQFELEVYPRLASQDE